MCLQGIIWRLGAGCSWVAVEHVLGCTMTSTRGTSTADTGAHASTKQRSASRSPTWCGAQTKVQQRQPRAERRTPIASTLRKFNSHNSCHAAHVAASFLGQTLWVQIGMVVGRGWSVPALYGEVLWSTCRGSSEAVTR